MKLVVEKYLFFLFLFLSSLTVSSQVTNYTLMPAGYSFGQTNALAEDTISDHLHFQFSCICGVGPGNVFNTLNRIDLANGVMAAPFYYGPYGVKLTSKGIHAHNNKVYVNEESYITGRSVPTYSPQNWVHTAALSETIIASVQRNDSIFIVKNDGSYCMTLQILNAITGTPLSYNSIECSTLINGQLAGDVFSAKISGNKLYLAGFFEFYGTTFTDTNAIAINIGSGQAIPLNLGTNDTIKDIELYNNKIHIAGCFTKAKWQTRNYYASIDLSGNLQTGTPSFNGKLQEIEVYDNYLFAAGIYTSINGNVVNPWGYFVLKTVNLTTNSVMPWNVSCTSSPLFSDDFILDNIRNRLYVVSRLSSGAGIDAYCLPPVKSTTAIATNTTVLCEGASLTFSVAPFLYASAYTWWYTGTGASVIGTGNTVNISFSPGASSGKVKMVASSACGGKSDTLSLNITILPRPHALASLVDDTINCFKPKVPLLGNSLTSNVSYKWSGPSGYTSSLQNDSSGKYLAGTYVLTVTSLSNGCTNSSSQTIKLDTIKPNVTLPLPPYVIPCNPNFLLLTGSSTNTPALVQWKKPFDTTYYSNPDSAKTAGMYWCVVKDLYNGCVDSRSISVTASTAGPIVAITSHTNYVNFSIPVDSITCLTPSVQISASATPSNCTILWKDKATNAISANPITVSSQGNYMPIVTRLDNSCVDSSKIVLIAQDIIPPNVSILTPSPNINCSYSTATLNAVVSPSTALSQWTGPSSFVASNPAVASVQGKYYFTATDPANGCVKKDSISLGYANVLVVNAGNDTVVCKNSSVPLIAAVAGTVSPLLYSWSNGVNAQNTYVNNAISTNYVVNVNGGGCNGTDTVRVIIPADIQDSIVTSKGCTGNSGNLVIYAKGGIPPYKYSVNGSAFTSVNSFTSLAFATHNIVIKDSIGCTRTTTASINQNSNSTVPVFIASTQNFKGDTVVFVDLTVPKADSIQWLLPNIATIIGGDMFSPVVVFADTGSFIVTMQAHYGNCMISATKVIRILPFDSAYATLINNNGIKLLNVFPNPNTGVFTVNVEFYKKQNASIQIWDANSQKHYQNNFIETDNINLPVSLSQLQNGTYILRVIGEYSSKHFGFVISK